jgi:hypothetical protein
MILPRLKLGYDLDNCQKFPLRSVVQYLAENQFYPEVSYYEFPISGDIKPEDLKMLLALPYEVGLTGLDNKVILSTGTYESSGLEPAYNERRINSWMHLHTHPLGRSVPITAPSISDLLLIDSKKQDSLVHPEGIMIYGKPTIGRRRHCNDIKEYLFHYGKKTRVELTGVTFSHSNEAFMNPLDFSKLEQVCYMRQLIEDAGIIVDEAGWDDRQGVKRVVDKIFSGFNK